MIDVGKMWHEHAKWRAAPRNVLASLYQHMQKQLAHRDNLNHAFILLD